MPASSQQKDNLICLDCVGEQYLKEHIKETGKPNTCHYCDKTDLATITISEFADRVGVAFQQHYELTDPNPSLEDQALIRDCDYSWERTGKPVLEVIMEAAELEEAPAEDIRKILEERNYDSGKGTIEEEMPYQESSHYEFRISNDYKYHLKWREFERSLQTEARYLNSQGKVILDEVFNGISSYKDNSGNSVIETWDATDDTAMLYRARVFQNQQDLEEALKRPDLHIGPPPFHLANAGRMNAHGIAVFYGATHEDVATSEVQPPVGSRVIIGKFTPQKDLRLLNIKRLKDIPVTESIFDSKHRSQLERVNFLETLSGMIAKPVMPDDEPMEYLVTQVVAEYLGSHDDLKLDGLRYPSIQNPSNGDNVVLFYKSSRLAAIGLPPHTKIDVSTGFIVEGRYASCYYIWLGEENETKHTSPRLIDHYDDQPLEYFDPSLADQREVSLSLDIQALKVFHIEGASFRKIDYPVSCSFQLDEATRNPQTFAI